MNLSFRSVTAVLTTLYFSVVVSAETICFGGIDDAPYLHWVERTAASYDAAVCYNGTSGDGTGIALHWKLDDENLYLAVAARASGWLGFGLAETGGMKGADVVLFTAAQPGVLRDAHILDVRLPVDDDCQDWVFQNSTVDGGFIIFEGYRKLDTLDSQDHAILDDSDPLVPPQRFIAAWGDTETVSYHGLNNAQGSLRWYSGVDELELIHQKLETQADGYFDLVVPNHTIQAVKTDYVTFCFAWEPDIAPQGVPANGTIEVIAAEAITFPESRPFIHHFDFSASSQKVNQSRTCLPKGSYSYTVYGWAPGVLPFVMPDNVGFLMGPGSEEGNGGLQSFHLIIHYNNPDLVEGVVDRGGIRVYYTLAKREHELGIMALADSLSRLRGEPIPAGLAQYEFGCLPGCSQLALDRPVTVIQEMVHMHAKGYAAESFQIRDNAVIREARIDYFNFDQSGLPVIRQKPFTINPGDSFISKLYFDTDNGTLFGNDSSEEMGKHLLLYYPAQQIYGYPWSCPYDVPLAVCNASLTSRVLEPNEPLRRAFGPAPGQCSAKATRNQDITSSSTAVGSGGRMLVIVVIVLGMMWM